MDVNFLQASLTSPRKFILILPLTVRWKACGNSFPHFLGWDGLVSLPHFFQNPLPLSSWMPWADFGFNNMDLPNSFHVALCVFGVIHGSVTPLLLSFYSVFSSPSLSMKPSSPEYTPFCMHRSGLV